MELTGLNTVLEGTVADNKKEQLFLSSIEEHLAQDSDGKYRDEVMKTLFSEALRLKAQKDKGASPEEFTRIDNILTGVVAAAEVVEKRWQQLHKEK